MSARLLLLPLLILLAASAALVLRTPSEGGDRRPGDVDASIGAVRDADSSSNAHEEILASPATAGEREVGDRSRAAISPHPARPAVTTNPGANADAEAPAASSSVAAAAAGGATKSAAAASAADPNESSGRDQHKLPKSSLDRLDAGLALGDEPSTGALSAIDADPAESRWPSEVVRPDDEELPSVSASIVGFRVNYADAIPRHLVVHFDVDVRNEEEESPQQINVAVYVRNEAVRLPRQIPWPSRKFVPDDSELVRERRAEVLGKDDAGGVPFRRVLLERLRLEEQSGASIEGVLHIDRVAQHEAWERGTLSPYSFGEYEIWLFDDDGRLLFERRYASIP